LGLRALYFALAGAMELFHFLNMGLALILAFVGVKMLLGKFYEIPVGVALGVVILTLVITIVASIMFPKSRQNKSSSAAPFKKSS
jgi:tellurite resistance protein TerC